MNRRRLLAVAGTGVASTLAGCGYAAGGGDVVDEGGIGSPGGFPWGVEMFATTEDRLLYADSGSFMDDDETTLSLADREGKRLHRHTYDALSWAAALDPSGTTVYLLAASTGRPDGEEPSGVAAVDLTADDPTASYAVVEGVDRPDDAGVGSPRNGGSGVLTADGSGAYCLVEDGIAAVRDGEEQWRRELDGSVGVHAETGGVVAVTQDGVSRFGSDGTERWEVSTAGPAEVATEADRTVVHADAELRLLDADGQQLWTVPIDSPGEGVRLREDVATVVSRNELTVVDAIEGSIEATITADLSPPTVWDGERVYSVGSGCTVLAADGDGERWRRELDFENCSIVDGWVDGETVAFLFESGELRWLRRTDEEPGLLW